MRVFLSLVVLLVLGWSVPPTLCAQDLPVLEPRAGLVITASVRLAPGTYLFPADSSGALTIRGANLVVDMTDVVLQGAPANTPPDQFTGTAIRIDGGHNITVVGAQVQGYKVGLWATDVVGLRVTGGDFSYNYRQRLKSTLEREHLDDWLSYHQNDADEWLRYGAALYLRRCYGAQVDHVTVTGGQNGLMLTEVDGGLFYNNTIHFNSGVGLGLYRSSGNRVLHNRLDWNVRGYSHGVYYRGQDSAAILVYEQSSNNAFAYNSATHSGDGFFLWAGQTTMDTGEGGCNDNLLYRNDFSYAPTNGIEVTFSSNRIIENTILGCWHGIWGGYSYDTVIEGNTFAHNDEHIAIEHGQRNMIRGNTFTGGQQGLRLWERPSQPADWGYAQNRYVESTDLRVEANTFAGVPMPLHLQQTDSVVVRANTFATPFDSLRVGTGQAVRLVDNQFGGYTRAEAVPIDAPDALGSNTFGVSGTAARSRRSGRAAKPLVDALPDSQAVFRADAVPYGRRFMLVDDWGPYDFRRPVLWPRSPRRDTMQVFELLGPPGTWRIVDMQGVDSVSARSGTLGLVPDTLVVWRGTGDLVDLRLNLEYVGGAVTDTWGRVTPAGTPFRFGASRFFVPIDWDVRFYTYGEATEPRSQPEAFRVLLEGPPAATDRTDDLGYQWYRSPMPGLPSDRFATAATGTFTVPPGRYRLDLTSDDGVRAWLDGALIHDDWTYHPPRLAEIDLDLGGSHTLVIEHFEIDGYATLVAALERVE